MFLFSHLISNSATVQSHDLQPQGFGLKREILLQPNPDESNSDTSDVGPPTLFCIWSVLSRIYKVSSPTALQPNPDKTNSDTSDVGPPTLFRICSVLFRNTKYPVLQCNIDTHVLYSSHHCIQ